MIFVRNIRTLQHVFNSYKEYRANGEDKMVKAPTLAFGDFFSSRMIQIEDLTSIMFLTHIYSFWKSKYRN